MLHERPGTIRDAAIRCAQLFIGTNGNISNTDRPIEQGHPLSQTSQTGHENLEFEVKEQLARFKIWVGSLGALASGRASADERLRDDPDIKDVILSLLHRLARRLERIHEAEPDPPPESDEGADDSSNDSISSLESDEDEEDAEEVQQNEVKKYGNSNIAEVSDLISRLYKFATFIRKAGSAKDDHRVNRWAEKGVSRLEDELQELETHVRWQLGLRYSKIVKYFPVLGERVVHTILQRRRRLLYRIDHQIKLESGMSDWFVPRNADSIIEESQEERNFQPGRHPGQEDSPVQDREPRKTVTFVDTIHTKATTLDRTGFSSCGRSAILSMISPSAKVELERLDVPPPPEPIVSGASEALCPYCNQILGPEIIGSAHAPRWNQHLLRDIEPYICLFDECITPGQRFRSRQEWINHMAWNHAKIWSCPMVDHQSQVFVSQASVKEHLMAEHSHEAEKSLELCIESAANLSPDVLAVYATSSRVRDSQEERGACPFCNDPSMSFDILEEGIQVTFQDDECRKKVESHIARHLEVLALLSLPAPHDLDEDDSKFGDTTGAQSSRFGSNYTPLDNDSSITFWNTIFGDAMARFNKTFAQRANDKGYDIRCKASWEEVTAQLDAAQMSYLEECETRGTITGRRGVAPGNVQSATNAVQLVTDIDYTAPVLGAVKILLGVVHAAADTRGRVVHGFDDLDQIFSEIELFLQTFPDDYKVRDTAEDLIIATFKAVELAIKFFTSSTGGRMANAMSDGDRYQKELRDSLSEMKACSQQLVQDALGSHMHHTQHSMRKILHELGALRRMHEAFVKAQEGQRDMLNSMTSLLTEYNRGQGENRHLRANINSIRSRTASSTPVTMYFTNNHDLLYFIGMPNFEKTDMQHILEKKDRLDSEQRMRAERLIHNRRFRDWYVSTANEILLIHGDFGQHDQKISTLSLFCTELAADLRAHQSLFPLVFFCGCHIEDGPPSGGLLMVTSLVLQLLSMHNFDMRWLPREIYDELKQEGDVAAFNSLFRWLLYQMPTDAVVFCLVDGVSYYEHDQFVESTSEVLVKILDMTRDGNLPVTVKVLVTSPTPTKVIRLAFEPKDAVISMAAISSREVQEPDQSLDDQRSLPDHLKDLRLEFASTHVPEERRFMSRSYRMSSRHSDYSESKRKAPVRRHYSPTGALSSEDSSSDDELQGDHPQPEVLQSP